MKNIIFAYAAGIFDGEGCVDIYSASTSKLSKSPSLMLRVVISQKDGKIMNWLKDNFGGNVVKSRKDIYYIYRWDIRSQAAKKFLLAIYPFSIIKKNQIKVALEYESIKEKYLLTLKGHQGWRRLSEEEIKARLEIKQRLSDLKKEYAPYIKNVCTNND